MPQVRQRGALGVLTKPRLLEVASVLGLGLPGRLLKPELVDAIAPHLDRRSRAPSTS